MANYTIKLCDIMKQIYLDKNYSLEEQIKIQNNPYAFIDFKPKKIIKCSRKKIFNFSYPIFDENYRETLEIKILTHYYDYEIGTETFESFKFNLYKKMNENMPYYNKLYLAMAKDYDFDVNIDYKETLTGEGTNEASNLTTNTMNSEDNDTQSYNYEDRMRKSDTPQNQLNLVEQGKYLSEYNYNNGTNGSTKKNILESENTIDGTSTGKTTSNTKRIVKGTQYAGSRAKMLKEYMEAIKNIDIDVIDSLKNCFFLIV